jgi:uncharacterized protein DUF3501
MKPLTLDDLIPLEEFVARRQELFDANVRYRDRYRRVRVGPRAILVFENRQTIWFRIQEIVRVARLTEPEIIQTQLDHYNSLLPQRDRLFASLLLDFDESRWAEEARFWSSLRGEHICLVVDSTAIAAHVLTARPEDRATGAAQWVEFTLGAAERKLLAGLHRPARIEIRYPGYEHVSAYLSEDLRGSLLDDLKLSDRDVAA